MKRSGVADLPIYGGAIPSWLFERMVKLSGSIVEAILLDQGHAEFLRRLSDPFWFQSFGAVIGMDWNSSGATTAVMSALKRSLNPRSRELGLYVCGGKGKQSRQTPLELLAVGEQTGLDGAALARCSKLSAKVDNTAVQDGYQLYLHSFVVSASGDWSVIQQGMSSTRQQAVTSPTARRYHWHSASLRSFVAAPHTAVCGTPQGNILNLVDSAAGPAQASMIDMAQQHPDRILKEVRHMKLPTHGDVRAENVNLKRLGSVLWLAQENEVQNFEELLALKGMGPRTLQSMALVSEVMYGTPVRFSDPARFSLAHGGKGGSPHPVLTQVYDESIDALRSSVEQAHLNQSDKQEAIKKLSVLAQRAEHNFVPEDNFAEYLAQEKENAPRYGGRTIRRRPPRPKTGRQLDLFQ